MTAWYGIEAFALESDALRVVIVPSMGAKIVSLQDKRSGTEWLVGPGERPVRPVPYGAVFTDQDMAGWDEMFPTIVACPYPGPGERNGVSLPDHGEVYCLPWEVEQADPQQVQLSVSGRALPYRLTRRASLPEPDCLRLEYQLTNLGPDPMPYLWSAHPQFLCGQTGQVFLPENVTEVINTLGEAWGWGAPESRYDWPLATAPDGRKVRLDQIGPASLGQARKFFALPDQRLAWAALRQQESGAWLRLEWNPEQVPYFGLWVDEGALAYASVAAPEPMTAWYDSLALAVAKGKAALLPPQAVHAWALTVRLGSSGSATP